MKKLLYVLSFFFLTPIANLAQEQDCNLEFVWQLYNNIITVQAVDFPEGANLIWTVNGEVIAESTDAIELLALAILLPVYVCVEYTSSDCPYGVEYCEGIDLGTGGGDCPTVLSSSPQDSGPCNWIFEVEGSTEYAVVNWSFGDGGEEVSSNVADHGYEQDGVYTVTALYIDYNCTGVVLTTDIVVEGCSENSDCINHEVLQDSKALEVSSKIFWRSSIYTQECCRDIPNSVCFLYTSDAADDSLRVHLDACRTI